MPNLFPPFWSAEAWNEPIRKAWSFCLVQWRRKVPRWGGNDSSSRLQDVGFRMVRCKTGDRKSNISARRAEREDARLVAGRKTEQNHYIDSEYFSGIKVESEYHQNWRRRVTQLSKYGIVRSHKIIISGTVSLSDCTVKEGSRDYHHHHQSIIHSIDTTSSLFIS